MKYLMTIKYATPLSLWAGLGFIRGVNSYNYYNNKPYMYSSSFMHGMFGVLIYVNPVFLPITTYKEFYRLEVNIRDLDEKKDNYYNQLL